MVANTREMKMQSFIKRRIEINDNANEPFEDSAHWVMLDQKERFYKYLANFIEIVEEVREIYAV